LSDDNKRGKLGLLLKELLNDRGYSLRKFSELTGIDPATISRIMNGKRKAKPEHLQRFAECLQVPNASLFTAAGYEVEQAHSDLHTSIDHIQEVLGMSDVKDFSMEKMEQELRKYETYAQTEEGKKTILHQFGEKLQKAGGSGPFIGQLNDLHHKFRLHQGSKKELALIGSALIYFILTVDCIPDYVFPIGYIDDALAVKLIIQMLTLKN
jgi:transcriptional regulator with XRE-family HTH domain